MTNREIAIDIVEKWQHEGTMRISLLYDLITEGLNKVNNESPISN